MNIWTKSTFADQIGINVIKLDHHCIISVLQAICGGSLQGKSEGGSGCCALPNCYNTSSFGKTSSSLYISIGMNRHPPLVWRIAQIPFLNLHRIQTVVSSFLTCGRGTRHIETRLKFNLFDFTGDASVACLIGVLSTALCHLLPQPSYGCNENARSKTTTTQWSEGEVAQHSR